MENGSFIFLGLIYIVIICIVVYFLVIIPIRNIIRLRFIPFHETWPILGNVMEMWKFQDEFNKLYERWVSKYGRGASVIWGTYWFPIVVLGDARDVKKVLSSRDHVSKGVLYRALDLAIGSGAFNSPVGIWRQRRPYLEQAFHYKVLANLPTIFDRCSRNLLQTLRKDGKDATDQEFDIHPYLNLCSIQMLVGGALGLNVDPFGKKDFWKVAVDNYNSGAYLAEYRMLRPWYLLCSTLWELTPSSRKMRTAVGWLYKHLFSEFLRIKIEMGHKNSNNLESEVPAVDKESNDKDNHPQDFLELLLHLQTTKKWLKLSYQDLIYEIASIYIAGTDASGKTMSFLLLFLALHKECQDKVVQELITIFGDDDNEQREITQEDCNKMRYLECCIKETLRLMPPVSFITRMIGSDVHLENGGCIPKGTEVVISTYAVHRNSDVYPEPNSFQPDRFFSEEKYKGTKIGPYDWIPFSAGPRNCLGPKFAILEIKTVVANILRNYRVETSSTPEIGKWVLHTNITLNLKGGWNLLLIPKINSNVTCRS